MSDLPDDEGSEEYIDPDSLRVDLTDAEENKFVPAPEGSYNLELTSAEVKKSEKSGKPYVNWEFTIEGLGKKVWNITSLDFGNTTMSKGKNPKPIGKILKDNFFQLLMNMGCFSEADLRGDLNVGDIMTQALAAPAKINAFLEIDEQYNNNKIKRHKPYQGSLLPD